MSNINNFRIVNLNYNNNTMKIDDEIFYFNGENTMLNLRNGGGKSVLVQMIMAPFANRRNRDLGDRPFESYFTNRTPTYILVEWNLEDDAGYLLTGMMVRKKDSSSDENSKDRLDIVNFVYEYKNKNEYDINNFPIIEENEGSRRIKSFINSKKMFEDLKKDSKYNFNYYDMNNYTTSKAYFNKLREYGIDNKEWENIIRKINLKESGLSELFKEAKNSEGLIKTWFLPTIEKKLNKDEDRIKNYKEIITRYIIQYKTNKSNIDRKNKIEIFNEKAIEVGEIANNFKEMIKFKESHENKIANSKKYFYDEILSQERILKDIQGLLEKVLNEKKEIQYEEISMRIYNLLDELDIIKKKIDNANNEKDDCLSEVESLKKEKNILRCAELYGRYKDISKELLEIENKLKVLKEEEGDKGPRINDLGFSILKLLKVEKCKLEEEVSVLEKEEKALQDKNIELNESVNNNEVYVNRLNNKIGELKAKINSYDKTENRFNKKYSENLLRNLTGYYNDEDLIFLSKEIESSIEMLNKKRIDEEKRYINLNEEFKGKKSLQENKNNEIGQLNLDIEYKNKKLAEYNSELEKIKDILKYLDADEDIIFKKEVITQKLEKKIQILTNDIREFNKEYEKLLKQLNVLKTGKVLELPKELEAELNKRDIDIIYGMKWLKNNGYSKEKNEAIVKRNPFIPYSLIMDRNKIEILKKEKLESFTSSPIPIIDREILEEGLVNEDNNIVEYSGMNFYISFNNKLLDEKQLNSLIKEYEEEIRKLEIKILEKEETKEFYIDKKIFIKESSLTMSTYNQLLNEIEEIKEKIVTNKKEIILLTNKIGEVEKNIKNSSEEIEKFKRDLIKLNYKSDDYNELYKEYEEYKNNKKNEEENEEKLKIATEYNKNAKKSLEDILKNLKLKEEAIRNYNHSLDVINININKYSSYECGNLIKKDLEDLKSEYDALVSGIKNSYEELIERQKDFNEKYLIIQKQLVDSASNYNLVDDDYININYNYSKFNEIENEIDKYNKSLTNIEKIITQFQIESAKIDSDVSHLKDEINKIVNTFNPKEKNLILNKNYKEELAKLSIKEKELYSKEKEKNKIINDLNVYASSLDEFDFEIREILELNLKDVNLKDYIGKLKRDNRINNENVDSANKKLERIVEKLSKEKIFSEDSLFKESIYGLMSFVNNPDKFISQLNIITQSYNTIIEKLKEDIELINKERNNIIDNIMEYISIVYKNISQLDNNSSIDINGKRVKMLNIFQPNWEENEEVYKLRIKGFVETLRNQCIDLLEKNENISELIDNRLNIIKLYDEIVIISSINIKLYKIEENKQKQISWDDVSKNSGGEGFLSAFVVLASLLSYMRKEDKDIFTRKEESKVLIMDNPFAQTNAAHLLKPLMDIAKKSNTQLICLTGLGGDSIYSRFDNIYVLNLINSKLKNGLRLLKSNHIVGDEEKEILVSTRTKIEDIQMKLF
ncbi:hypothetical protein [Clostridium sp. ATCC 25772]|uniref:hypothetical protein n=1 Tax=Clostridium sp. ATCC 25772 TaxID=1676991 RepID=UPI0007841561|nr:hypothetical protein [Clostridium sp. ATCC 25772]